MKKVKLKSYCLGIASAILVYSLCSPALATSAEKQITAQFQNIKIVLDGETLTPTDATGTIVEPFIVNGTTYLPVRALGEAIGKNVSWDGATSTVYLDEPSTAPVAPATSHIPTATSGNYKGSIDSDKYHTPGCRMALQILDENAIWWDTAEEARNSGYQPCGICHPY